VPTRLRCLAATATRVEFLGHLHGLRPAVVLAAALVLAACADDIGDGSAPDTEEVDEGQPEGEVLGIRELLSVTVPGR
jgi:hypothetical protein